MAADHLSWIRGVLATTPARWQRLAQAIPTDLLAMPAAPGEWSALACLRHLLDTEREVFPVRVQAFLAGHDFANWDPETRENLAAGETLTLLTAEFVTRRAASLVALDSLTTQDLARTAQHSTLGTVTLAEMLHEWAAHDLNHTMQAERAIMQPFIAGCGPWRESFAEHDLAGA